MKRIPCKEVKVTGWNVSGYNISMSLFSRSLSILWPSGSMPSVSKHKYKSYACRWEEALLPIVKVNPTCVPSRWISLKISSFLSQRNPESQSKVLNTSRESIKSALHSFVYIRVLSLSTGLILERAFSRILIEISKPFLQNKPNKNVTNRKCILIAESSNLRQCKMVNILSWLPYWKSFHQSLYNFKYHFLFIVIFFDHHAIVGVKFPMFVLCILECVFLLGNIVS